MAAIIAIIGPILGQLGVFLLKKWMDNSKMTDDQKKRFWAWLKESSQDRTNVRLYEEAIRQLEELKSKPWEENPKEEL